MCGAGFLRDSTITDSIILHIGAPFTHVTGLLAGRPEYESARLSGDPNDLAR